MSGRRTKQIMRDLGPELEELVNLVIEVLEKVEVQVMPRLTSCTDWPEVQELLRAIGKLAGQPFPDDCVIRLPLAE